MPNLIKQNQLARLEQDTVKAIQAWRKDMEKELHSTPSANRAINTLIVMGYELYQQRRAQAQKTEEK